MIKLIKLIKEDNFFGLKVGDKVTFKDSSENSAAIIKYGVNPKTVFKIITLHAGHPEVPNPNTYATLKDNVGNEIKKVYTGYLKKEMSEATFTNKYDDNPKLKGKQTKLPDELQAKLVKESDTPKHKIIAQLMGPDFFLSKKNERDWDNKDYNLFNRIMQMASEEGKVPKLNENQDHEVSMAQSSLESIIKSATQLMSKLGTTERNIPGWIQDHITNAENYIDQAAQGFHELNEIVKILPQKKTKGTYINGKEVDLKTIHLDGIDMNDYPDFSDAYIAYAEFMDGTKLNTDECFELEGKVNMNELVFDYLY